MNLQSHTRFIPLEGSINFRDFGGYKTVDGQLVKWRSLFRCGSLAMLSDDAKDEFKQLNISVICDLRRDEEAAHGPTPSHPPFDCRKHIPIAQASSGMLRESMLDRSQTVADRIKFMTDITRELARNHHQEYRQLFEHLLAAQGGFLLHCSAGKDRTGFGVALILAALGVDEETIMGDYLLTNEAECLREFMRSSMRGHYGAHIDDASLEVIGGVRQAYLQAALDEVCTMHGTLAAYLEEIGVDENNKHELQRKLLVAL